MLVNSFNAASPADQDGVYVGVGDISGNPAENDVIVDCRYRPAGNQTSNHDSLGVIEERQVHGIMLYRFLGTGISNAPGFADAGRADERQQSSGADFT